MCLQCKRPRFNPWVSKTTWRRKWLTTPVFLPGEFHGQRILSGYSPWVRKKSDMTGRVTHSLFMDRIIGFRWERNLSLIFVSIILSTDFFFLRPSRKGMKNRVEVCVGEWMSESLLVFWEVLACRVSTNDC